MYWGFRAPSDPAVQEELAGTLAPLGFNWMEVDAPLAPDPEEARRLRALCARWGLQLSIHCHFVDVNPSALHPRVRDAAMAVLRDDLEFAAQAGARVAVMHPGDIGWFDFFPADHPLYAEGQSVVDDLFRRHTEVFAESVTELGRLAQDRGVLLTFENMYNPWDLLCRPAEMADFLSRCSPPGVAVILDTGHARVAGYTAGDFVAALGSRIGHTHIHWNDGKYDLHLPLSAEAKTELNCLRELVRLRPEICLMVELPPRNPGEYVDSIAVLREILDS